MTEQERSQIERINQVSAMARTSWITLLAYLAFVGVTLLAVEDADFFVPSRQTQLPLVDVAIPTASFFVFAPILAAALYVYLHIILLKLWDAIADISYEYGATIDGQPLGDHLNPWLVNDWALTRKGGPFAPERPLRTVGNLASFLLVWAAAPLVFLAFWWRSMPAHDEWLTLLLAACVLIALHAGVTSWRTARAWLASPRHLLADRHWRHRDVWYLGALFACVTLLRTEFPLETGALSTLAPTNLANVEMVDLPEGWRAPETARHAFRETWCRREGLDMAVCDHLPEPGRPLPPYVTQEREKWCEAHTPPPGATCVGLFARLDSRFRTDWEEERSDAIADLPKLDLSGSDLRRAVGRNITLAGANLGKTRLDQADLSEARLEGADLSGARLKGAALTEARLEGAYLVEARLEGADLSAAQLEGAYLIGAQLEGANLSGARLKGANLFGARLQLANFESARLEGADLSAARLDGANLIWADFRSSNWDGASSRASPAWSADFRAAKRMTQAQLEGFVGDAGTLLPDGPAPDTGKPWYIWSCWERPPPDLERIVAAAAFPFQDEAKRSVLKGKFLCGPGSPRRKTGTPLALDAPYPEGHPLADRD